MTFRIAFVAVLLTVLATACTVNRFPGDCQAVPATAMRTKNRALIEAVTNPDLTTVPLAASC